MGSELVDQDFTEDYFFRGRVSSVNYNTYTEEQKENGEYTGVSSGSFNYANSNPELEKRIQEDLDEFLETHPGVKREDIPSDLLTASGSGLDPHISPEAAQVQVAAVAEKMCIRDSTGTVKKIDTFRHRMLLKDETEIPFENLWEIVFQEK